MFGDLITLYIRATMAGGFVVQRTGHRSAFRKWISTLPGPPSIVVSAIAFDPLCIIRRVGRSAQRKPTMKKAAKIHPVTPIDLALKKQFRYTVAFYLSGRGKIVTQLDALTAVIPKLMEAQLDMLGSYERGEFSPSLQKQFVALMRKVIKRYPTD